MKSTLDNLLAWRAFLAVAKTGSISGAASIVDLDPPTVSHMVSDIENEMGVRLLDRKRRPFRLTPKGRVLVDTIQPLTSGMSEVREMFAEDTNSIITVSAPTDLNQIFYHDHLFQYSLRNPGVHFYLCSSCPVEDVLNGRVDVALIDRPVSHPELVVRFCIQSNTVPLAARGYVEKYGKPETIDDLKYHTGLLLRQGMHQRTSYLFDEAGNVSPAIKWKNVFMTDAQLTLNHMMLDELGIVVDCAAIHLADEIAAGRVVRVLEGWRRKPQILSVVTRRDREATSEVVHDFAIWWTAHNKEVSRKSREIAAAKIGSYEYW